MSESVITTETILQEYAADLLIADWANYCARAVGEVLQVPHVGLMTGPIVDPLLTSWDLHTGVRLNVPNIISIVPQAGSQLGSPMVITPTLWASTIVCEDVERTNLCGSIVLQSAPSTQLYREVVRTNSYPNS